MMADRATYHVVAERDAKWWVLKVLELNQWSQSKSLDQATATARDLIALWLDVAPDSFDVELTSIHMAPAAMAARDLAVDGRRAAEAATTQAAEATKVAIAILTREGLSLRDVGRILGISFQRVAQLAAEPMPVTPSHLEGSEIKRKPTPTAKTMRAAGRKVPRAKATVGRD